MADIKRPGIICGRCKADAAIEIITVRGVWMDETVALPLAPF
jgi:hypothetical protein